MAKKEKDKRKEVLKLLRAQKIRDLKDIEPTNYRYVIPIQPVLIWEAGKFM
jgi:hypothetical protein